jgi:6,7-dimethyl-8-ribityllumazine synthase
MAMKIAFVVAEFNSEVTLPMEECARRHAESLGVEVARVVRVPGVYDMAPVVKALLQRKEIEGVVMIGAVIKGETNHDEVIAHAIARAGIELSLEFDKPVGLSIIGPAMTDDQAVARIENAKRGVDAVVKVARAIKEIRG